MAKTLVIQPVTRIEGHAKITIQLDDSGNVDRARVNVIELRGFEKFCQGKPVEDLPRITPFLWFEQNAEEAVEFYISIFENSRRIGELRNPGGAPVPPGSILTISFELDGQRFTALNGGANYKFNEAVSFVVRCDSQQEIDYYWEKLLAGGGSEIACGWMRDRFGLCWQIVPARLPELMRSPAAMQALMKMKKLVIEELERAGNG